MIIIRGGGQQHQQQQQQRPEFGLFPCLLRIVQSHKFKHFTGRVSLNGHAMGGSAVIVIVLAGRLHTVVVPTFRCFGFFSRDFQFSTQRLVEHMVTEKIDKSKTNGSLGESVESFGKNPNPSDTQ